MPCPALLCDPGKPPPGRSGVPCPAFCCDPGETTPRKRWGTLPCCVTWETTPEVGCPALLCDPGNRPPREEVGVLPSLPHSQSPAAMSTPSPLFRPPLRVSPGVATGHGGRPARVPRTGGSHVSSWVRLVYLAAQETGGGAFWGGRDLAFKVTPPGSALGLRGGSAGTGASPLTPTPHLALLRSHGEPHPGA